MKKTCYVIVFAVLLLGIACSVGVSNSSDALYQRDDEVYEDTLFFMTYEKQDLQILYSEDDGRLFVASYITLDKSKLKDLKQICFILDEDTKIKDFLINGKQTTIDRMLTFNENNFDIPVEYKVANRIKFLAEIWKFEIPEEFKDDDEIKLVIKYQIYDQAKGQAYHQKSKSFELNGDMFWYPQTLSEEGVVGLNLDIKNNYTVKSNGREMQHQNLKSYKSYTHTIQNVFSEPLSIVGTKNKITK